MVVMACVGYLHGNVIRQRICGLVQSAGYLTLNTVSALLRCVLLRALHCGQVERKKKNRISNLRSIKKQHGQEQDKEGVVVPLNDVL